MKVWKILLVLGVVGALGVGGYLVYSQRVTAQDKNVPQQQTVTVRRGNLEETISATGSVLMPNQRNLTFGVAGTLKALLVKEGDRVKKDQPLARLDLVPFERAVVQARAQLAQAETPYSTADIAAAESTLASAQARVKEAERAFQDVQPPYNLSPYTPADIAQAEAAVASAQAQVKEGEKAFQDVQPPYNLSPYTPADIAQAEAGVASAQAQVKEAENALSKALPAQTEQDLAHLRAAVDDAQKALAIAQQNLKAAELSRDRNVADAQELLRQEQEKYKALIRITLVGDTIYLDPRIILATETISDRLQTAYQTLLKARWDAQIAEEQGGKGVASAQAAVSSAEVALTKAQENLARKEKDIPVALTVQQYQLESAKGSLIKAQDELKKRQAGPEPEVIASRRLGLDSAKASLIKAQEELALVKGGGSSLDIELREAQIAKAQADYDDAKDGLAKATLVAPFEGVVEKINVEINQSLAANTQAMLLVDPSQIEVEVIVDEIDVPRLRPGQDVRLSLEAFTDVQWRGQVKVVSLTGEKVSGVVSYKVKVTTTPREEIQLREGLTIQANIVLERKQNVLLVPNRAVKSSGANRMVQVLVEGQAQPRRVKIGTANDAFTEITEGLQEGDTVVIETSVASRTTGPMMGGPAIGGVRFR